MLQTSITVKLQWKPVTLIGLYAYDLILLLDFVVWSSSTVQRAVYHTGRRTTGSEGCNCYVYCCRRVGSSGLCCPCNEFNFVHICISGYIAA
jgi:hypothetical protein